MCRWMAWHGQPVLVHELLFDSPHGIVDQSLHSRMGAETTNGDGFGLGWYGAGEGPAVYHSVTPAWSDVNLREIAAHIEAPVFLAHIRAAIGSPVQQTNCHPFRHGNWLFVPQRLCRRHARSAPRPDARARLRPLRGGPGLDRHRGRLPPRADATASRTTRSARWRGRSVQIEETARRQGREPLVQGTFGISDGESLGRCATPPRASARSLFASCDVAALRQLYPDNKRFARLRDDDRLIVSEPFSDLPGVWEEIPQSSSVRVAADGVLEPDDFQPLVPVG